MNVAKPGILALLCFLAMPLVLLNGCLGLGDFRSNDQIIKDITLEEAFALMEDNRYDENFVIIDVRTPEEYAGEYIEKAINLDYNSETFADELDQLDKEKTYLIYCRTDHLSGEALDMMLKEGLTNIIARHARIGKAARDGVKSLGLSLFAEEKYASNTVTAVTAKEGLDIKKLVKVMREEHQIVLAGGQQSLEGKIFRIGHLGWVTEDDIAAVISALKVALPKAGTA